MAPQRFNEDLWFNWQQPAVPLLLDLTFEACGRRFKEAFELPFFTSVLYYRVEGTGTAETYQASWLLRIDEGIGLGRQLVDMLQVPSAAARVEEVFSDACETLLQRSAEMEGEPTPKGVEAELERIDAFCEAFLDFYAVGSITEPVQWYAESAIGQLLSDELAELRPRLFAMDDEPYAFAIERSLLEMAIAAKKHDLDPATTARHAREYHWTGNNYARVLRLDEAHVRSEVEELASGDPEARLSKLREERRTGLERKAAAIREVPPAVRRLAILADRFGSSMADRRKAVMNRSLCGIDAAAGRLAGELRIDSDVLALFGPRELRALCADPERAGAEAAERREAYVQTLAPFPLDEVEMAVAIDLDGAGTVIPRAPDPSAVAGADALQLLDQIDRRMGLFDEGEAGPLRGEVVQAIDGQEATTLSGRCRVVTDPHLQGEEFEVGEILLANSTTPDYVPIMRKAAAVVTNMGGILQHAAHFAREERKPCIVGTGFATSAFETGEEISLDFATGEISSAVIAGRV